MLVVEDRNCDTNAPPLFGHPICTRTGGRSALVLVISRRFLPALAAAGVVLLAGCNAQVDTALEPVVPAEQARERVPELLERATSAFNLKEAPPRLPTDVEEKKCDDRAGQPDPDSLIRVLAGRQIAAPAGDAEDRVAKVSATLAAANRWTREKAPVGSSWRLRTPEGYGLVLRPVSPEIMTVSIVSPCARP